MEEKRGSRANRVGKKAPRPDRRVRAFYFSQQETFKTCNFCHQRRPRGRPASRLASLGRRRALLGRGPAATRRPSPPSLGRGGGALLRPGGAGVAPGSGKRAAPHTQTPRGSGDTARHRARSGAALLRAQRQILGSPLNRRIEKPPRCC